MTDIREFIAARLDEDEAAARHVVFNSKGRDRWETGAVTYRDGYAFVAIHTPDGLEIAGAGLDGTGGVHGEVFATHIARHDPARVLAQVAAQRRLLDLHPIGSLPEKWGDIRHHPDQDYPRVNRVGEPTGSTVYYCELCDHVSNEYDKTDPEAYSVRALPGCETLLAVASAWSAHPDHDPAWRIDA